MSYWEYREYLFGHADCGDVDIDDFEYYTEKLLNHCSLIYFLVGAEMVFFPSSKLEGKIGISSR